MKKLFCVASLLLASGLMLSTNAQRIEKGKLIGGAGAYLERTITPILLSAEYGLGEKIGVGGLMWFAKGYSFLGGRANYHLNKDLNVSNDKLDTYTGLTAGKVLNSGQEGVSIFIHGGGRYFFNDKFGLFAELNLGVYNAGGSSLGAGLAINLK